MLKQLLDKLDQIMQNDSELAWVWHCNIAMSIKDEGVSPEQANRAAARCMKTLFQVDVTKFERWQTSEKQLATETEQSSCKWTPKIGDWVRIKKPSDTQASAIFWWPSMDKHDGKIVEIKEIDEDPVVHDDWAYIGKAIIHDEWAFVFDWLEPVEQPKWTPRIGDWVRIKKPSDTKASANSWWPEMDKYDGQIIQVKEIDGDGVVQDDWGFPFDWLEPVEPTLYSDKIPEGYRKLGDSSIEPRQLGDLRWSVSEKRYIEISVNEIEYANRDNWAACRTITPEVTGEPEPPDGWRFLEIGCRVRIDITQDDPEFSVPEMTALNGQVFTIVEQDWEDGPFYYLKHIDIPFSEHLLKPIGTPLNSDKIPEGYRKLKDSSIEPRQLGDLRWSVDEKRYVGMSIAVLEFANRDNWAACRKIKPDVKQSLTPEPPDGWRFLEEGEVIREGDIPFENGQMYGLEPIKIGMTSQSHWKPIIRRNRFEVGEKVVHVQSKDILQVVDVADRVRVVDVCGSVSYYPPEVLAPCIAVTREVTGEVAGEVAGEVTCATKQQSDEPPVGHRWLAYPERLMPGDRAREGDVFVPIAEKRFRKMVTELRRYVRRNSFEIGEVVVCVNKPNMSCVVTAKNTLCPQVVWVRKLNSIEEFETHVSTLAPDFNNAAF